MASNPNDGPPNGPQDPNAQKKELSLWAEPMKEGDVSNSRPSIKEAAGMIKSEDFANIASYPCARTGLLQGIGSGFGMGGLRFILGGTIGSVTNWAAGFFIFGSMASYEWCQYQRREEKRKMKRHVEVINQGRKEHAQKLQEQKWEERREEEEKLQTKKPWYKVW